MIISCLLNIFFLFNEIKLPSDVQFMKLSNICLSLICYIRDLLKIEQKIYFTPETLYCTTIKSSAIKQLPEGV